MDIEEVENKIDELEEAYTIFEDAISTLPNFVDGKIANQVLDGIQYFINELSWEQKKLEQETENCWTEN